MATRRKSQARRGSGASVIVAAMRSHQAGVMSAWHCASVVELPGTAMSTAASSRIAPSGAVGATATWTVVCVICRIEFGLPDRPSPVQVTSWPAAFGVAPVQVIHDGCVPTARS